MATGVSSAVTTTPQNDAASEAGIASQAKACDQSTLSASARCSAGVGMRWWNS
jgi:hypothetical protein